MHSRGSDKWRYVLAAALSAIGGGLVVMLVTRAIPRLMSQMMSGMMQNMMTQMAEGNCAPSEI